MLRRRPSLRALLGARMMDGHDSTLTPLQASRTILVDRVRKTSANGGRVGDRLSLRERPFWATSECYTNITDPKLPNVCESGTPEGPPPGLRVGHIGVWLARPTHKLKRSKPCGSHRSRPRARLPNGRMCPAIYRPPGFMCEQDGGPEAALVCSMRGRDRVSIRPAVLPMCFQIDPHRKQSGRRHR
jgi:hypothetical protein